MHLIVSYRHIVSPKKHDQNTQFQKVAYWLRTYQKKKKKKNDKLGKT